MREQVLGPAERAAQVHVADQRREVTVANGPDLAGRVADAGRPGLDLDVARQDPVHVDARAPSPVCLSSVCAVMSAVLPVAGTPPGALLVPVLAVRELAELVARRIKDALRLVPRAAFL